MRDMNNIATEVLSVLHWSREARAAYNKALEAYHLAGRPGHGVSMYKAGAPSNIVREIPVDVEYFSYNQKLPF